MKQLAKLFTVICFLYTLCTSLCAHAEPIELNLILFANPGNQVHEQFSLVYPKFPRFDFQEFEQLPECSSSVKLDALSSKLSDNRYEVLYKRCVVIESSLPHVQYKLSNMEPEDTETPPNSIVEAVNRMNHSTLPLVFGAINVARGSSLDISLDLIYARPTTFDGPKALGRLKSKRKIHLKEINYFDHPLFGALVFAAGSSV